MILNRSLISAVAPFLLAASPLYAQTNYNNALIEQVGNMAEAEVKQTGQGNANNATINQSGAGAATHAELIQSGEENQNTSRIDQIDGHQTASVRQDGTNSINDFLCCRFTRTIVMTTTSGKVVQTTTICLSLCK